jgi:SAM-dependent methyltransferase
VSLYDQIGPIYDLIYPGTAERVPFVRDLLQSLGVSSVLELGAGTGLYLQPLAEAGFEAEGLEISDGMIAVGLAKNPALVFHRQDARSFSLVKKYDAILALSSFFVVLDEEDAVGSCLRCCARHLNPGGYLLAELPNHDVEIAEMDGRQEVFRSEDDSVAVVIQSRASETQWHEDWHVFETTEGGFSNRTVRCSEWRFDPAAMRARFEAEGMVLQRTWGDLLGRPFEARRSPRHVWLWQRP